VFGEGGGLGYWQEPTFGYLLGFLPAAYLAGMTAFIRPRDLVNFAWSGILALVVVHLTGMGYLLLRFFTQPALLGSYCFKYTIALLPSHLAILCSCSSIAYIMRLVLLY
jgi:biotin transport system substrate-specific component